MESCCRACSRSDEFRRFSLYAVAEVSQEVIANMIRDTSDTQVSTEDGLPQQICPDCLMTLSLAYTFRKQCRRSDAKFREYWGGRTPSQSIDQQQQQQQHQHPHPHPQQPSQPHQLPRRSQSQVPDESSFEVATAIKEEVDIYDYEYSVSSAHDEQLLIQNPRTIGEGAMTVVHTGGQYYDDGAGASETSGTGDRDGHGMMQHPMDDSYEMGECSGLGQKKLKNKAPSPERFSQRIRRQELTASMTETAPRHSETDWGRWSVSVIPEASLLAAPPTIVTNAGQQQRCQHCQKKMKKPYKHRNGKCLEPKYKASNRAKCAYCHQTFSSSKGIPSHLRNSCRVYRQVCEAKGISLPDADQSSSPYDTSSVPSETPEPPAPVLSVLNNQKPPKQTQATTWTHSIVCQYCNKKFLKKAALNRHLQKQCLVWVRRQTENLAALKSGAREVTTTVPLPLPLSLDDKSAIAKDHQAAAPVPPTAVVEELTKCVYCQQGVSKKSRYLHHNGRCVLGRVNAEEQHACPHCPEAFMTRSLLLKHRCDPAQMGQNNSTSEPVQTNAGQPPEGKQRRVAKLTPKKLALLKAKSPVKQITTTPARKQHEPLLETPTSIVKREFCSHCRQRIKDSDRQKHAEKRCFNNNEVTYNCGYCRKAFAVRDSLIEHQRICTVRKQHKQVKCTACGLLISNRAYLKTHKKLYCKSNKQGDDVKSEKPDKPQKQVKLQKLEKSSKPPKSSVKAVVKSEKVPLKVKKVKVEEQVKKKRKFKKEKPNNTKGQEDDVENIPLKQRKLHKPKSTVSVAAVETKKPKQKPAATKKIRFPCEYCKLKFETESIMRKHRLKCTVRQATLTIICQHCSQRFSRQGNLERHLRLKCKNIDRDKSVVNQTISELIRSENTDTMNSTMEDEYYDDEEESAPKPTEQDPIDPPSEPLQTVSPEPERTSPEQEPPATASTEPEQSDPEPVTPTITEQPEEPAQIPEEPPQTPPAHEEVDAVPEPIEEEEILPEEELPIPKEDEMEHLEEAEEHIEEPEAGPEDDQIVEEPTEAASDEHHEPDNNNAEHEKASSPDVEQRPSTPVAAVPPPIAVIERHDDSQRSAEDLVPECEPNNPEPEPEPVEPMQVDQATN